MSQPVSQIRTSAKFLRTVPHLAFLEGLQVQFLHGDTIDVEEEVIAFMHAHPVVRFVDVFQYDDSWTFSRNMGGISRTTWICTQGNILWRECLIGDVAGK